LDPTPLLRKLGEDEIMSEFKKILEGEGVRLRVLTRYETTEGEHKVLTLHFKCGLYSNRANEQADWSCGWGYPGVKIEWRTLHHYRNSDDPTNYVSEPQQEARRYFQEWEPTALEVMGSLVSDARCVKDVTARDFCSEFGYVDDDGSMSRKGLDTYLACQDAEHKLRDLLGWTAFNKVMELDQEDIEGEG
jgi:hypothetical protein